MSDKKTVLKDLIEQGKRVGKISTQEITDALEALDFDAEQVDKLYGTLENHSIEIVEDLATEVETEISLPREYAEAEYAVAEGIEPGMLPGYIVGTLVAAVAGYFAIRLVNILADKNKFGNFAYYCWGIGAAAVVATLIFG